MMFSKTMKLLEQAKQREGKELARGLFEQQAINCSGDPEWSWSSAVVVADSKVSKLTTKELYAFLSQCGYDFNYAKCEWVGMEALS